jgi:hypothetical protein
MYLINISQIKLSAIFPQNTARFRAVATWRSFLVFVSKSKPLLRKALPPLSPAHHDELPEDFIVAGNHGST